MFSYLERLLLALDDLRSLSGKTSITISLYDPRLLTYLLDVHFVRSCLGLRPDYQPRTVHSQPVGRLNISPRTQYTLRIP
jgi:hypothetical protein